MSEEEQLRARLEQYKERKKQEYACEQLNQKAQGKGKRKDQKHGTAKAQNRRNPTKEKPPKNDT